MTDEQKKARKLSAESGEIKWIKDHCLRTADDNEDYVFISYKSDDYKWVLDDILAKTCRKYGLRVYFDVAFDDGADSWINQFYSNMCSSHCKAMIAFLSNEYYSSYATLLEMMARKTHAAGGDYEYDTLFFLPINLERIKDQLDGSNTGLGTERFSDGTINYQAAKELALFNEIFEQLVSHDNRLGFIYNRYKEHTLYREATQTLPKSGAPYLSVTQCRKLMGLVCPDCNENDGRNKAFTEAIHDKLLVAGLGSVFIPDWPGPDSEPDPGPGPGPGPEPDPGPGPDPEPDPGPGPDPRPKVPEKKTISLPDFLKKYNVGTFKKETFEQVRLVGQKGYEAYSTQSFDSVYPVVWEFVMKLLKERGEAYLHFVNGRNQDSKNPPFITAEEHQKRKEERQPVTYRKIELPGLEGYSMCRHYGQYNWVSDVLRKRIQEVGMPLDAFAFEYVEPGQGQQGSALVEPGVPAKPEAPAGSGEQPDAPTGGITGPVTLVGEEPRKRKRAAGGYDFDICGQSFHGLPLNKMMLTVFRRLLEGHPDKLDLLLDKLPCLGEGIEIGPNARPATFRAGISIEIDGRSISIGTSLGEAQVKSYMERLVRLCGEPEDCLIVYNSES